MLAAALSLALAAATAAAPPAKPAPSGEATALARKVQDFYERTHDLQAAFVQTYTYAGFGRKQVSKGTLQVKKPGMMRWDYTSPSPKTIAVKGSRLVQWEPDEDQAYVDDHFDASAMSAAVAFLLGKGDLVKEFDVSATPGGALVLRPKQPDPRVDSIELAVAPDGEVRATRVVDGSGNVNQIEFENVRRNVVIPDSAFDVKIPKGAQRMSPPGR